MPDPDQMTLFEHLAELRRRIIISLAAFVVCAIATYIEYPRILHFLLGPLRNADPANAKLYVFAPLDAFTIRLDITAYVGVAVALPVIIFHIWRFVTPGLKANEKRYAIPFSIATFGLFILGAFVAWITYPHALRFLRDAGGSSITLLPQPQKYLGLLAALVLIFGLTFEFPVVLVALELAKVITPQQLAKTRRIAIVAIVVISGVITPSSDPFSMLALAVPMLVFYEVSILIGRYINRRR